MSSSSFGTIIQIGDILVSEDVVNECFACDYEVCKGKCCIIGDSGAPLSEEELDELENHYDEYSDLMTEQGRAAVDAKGFFEIDIEGDLVTPVVPGREECAYCHFDGDNCLCAIEKRFFEKKCSWQKPKSCRLYPIRVTKLSDGGLALNVHHWDICKDAFEKGKRENIRVYEFLRTPLTELFGEEFYSALSSAAENLFPKA